MDIQYILLASFVSMLLPKMTRSYVIGCYQFYSGGWDYAADGISNNLQCSDHCFQTQNKIYSGMISHNCSCRLEKPPDSYLVPNWFCDTDCVGGSEFCGGIYYMFTVITVSQKELENITVATAINIDGTVAISSNSTTMIDTTQEFTVKTTTEPTTTKSDAISLETTETAPESTKTEDDTVSIEIMETTPELSTTECRTTAVEMTRITDSLVITTETSPETMTNQPAGLLHCSLNVIMVQSTSPITGIEKLLVNPSTSNKMAYEGNVMITFNTESRIACVAKCSVLNDCFVAEFRKAMKECMLKSKYNQYSCETTLDNEVVSFIIR